MGTAANIGIQPANAADCAAPNCAMGAAGLSGFDQFLQHLHVHDLRYVDNITGADGNSKLLSSIVVPGTTWANLAVDSIRAPDYPHTKKGETLSAFFLDYDPSMYSANRFIMNSNQWWLRFQGVNLYEATGAIATNYVMPASAGGILTTRSWSSARKHAIPHLLQPDSQVAIRLVLMMVVPGDSSMGGVRKSGWMEDEHGIWRKAKQQPRPQKGEGEHRWTSSDPHGETEYHSTAHLIGFIASFVTAETRLRGHLSGWDLQLVPPPARYAEWFDTSRRELPDKEDKDQSEPTPADALQAARLSTDAGEGVVPPPPSSSSAPQTPQSSTGARDDGLPPGHAHGPATGLKMSLLEPLPQSQEWGDLESDEEFWPVWD